MAVLDIELSSELIDGLKRLAARHYGDSGESSMGRVVEAALEMRLLWLDLSEIGGQEVGEPVIDWKDEGVHTADQVESEVRDWLFKGR